MSPARFYFCLISRLTFNSRLSRRHNLRAQLLRPLIFFLRISLTDSNGIFSTSLKDALYRVSLERALYYASRNFSLRRDVFNEKILAQQTNFDDSNFSEKKK